MSEVRFLKSCIKQGDKKWKVFYSIGNYTKESGLSEDTITVYNREYEHFPKELNYTNESDMMTDYFEKDRLKICKGDKYYEQALKFC